MKPFEITSNYRSKNPTKSRNAKSTHSWMRDEDWQKLRDWQLNYDKLKQALNRAKQG